MATAMTPSSPTSFMTHGSFTEFISSGNPDQYDAYTSTPLETSSLKYSTTYSQNKDFTKI
jgi:hypothetical protein